ncbi:MAG: hypothetical protein GX025_06715 [Clostridiales bacterium]|nr:hypothetical protein [Clostridiales bacterium]
MFRNKSIQKGIKKEKQAPQEPVFEAQNPLLWQESSLQELLNPLLEQHERLEQEEQRSEQQTEEETLHEGQEPVQAFRQANRLGRKARSLNSGDDKEFAQRKKEVRQEREAEKLALLQGGKLYRQRHEDTVLKLHEQQETETKTAKKPEEAELREALRQAKQRPPSFAMPEGVALSEAGYNIQKLINLETALESYRGQRVGRCVADHRRLVQNLAGEPDLAHFCREGEAKEGELKLIENLSPQILREHTTDWLLCNFTAGAKAFAIGQTDGENVLYGLDKTQALQRINEQGAQKMSSSYCPFEAEILYNRVFQSYAAGELDLNLEDVLVQIEKVEQMSDEDYIEQFSAYLNLRKREMPQETATLEQNILSRKSQLRAEYRSFFEGLVRERMENLSPEKARELAERYLGGKKHSYFRFPSETEEVLLKEQRVRESVEKEKERERLGKAAKKADFKDNLKYNIRHGFYDFSKNIVMGLKSIKKSIKNFFVGDETVEVKQLSVSLAEIEENGPSAQYAAEDKEVFMAQYQAQKERIIRTREEQLRREKGLSPEEELGLEDREQVQILSQQDMKSERIILSVGNPRSIFLGGTKPMSEYYGSDGSRWLAKQAVNCMGYYKLDGAILTEAGARVQRLVHPETAVDAFVGKTRQHGDVSFQRRLKNVESGPDKLDLFRFSKHPEIADEDTIKQVEDLSSQILREHTSDWLLCNFDTKGENFIITINEQGQRVLHGIDKEAAFNNILEPEAQTMSRDYKPHTNNTLYNVIFSMYAQGKIDLELKDVLPQIEKIEQMSDDNYLENFREFLEYKQGKVKPEIFNEIRENILRRKRNLRVEYERFFTVLINERCRTLNEEAAAALKAKYFGSPQGESFWFGS